MIRVLYVGESWLGSCARSLREALGRCRTVCLDEVNEDRFIPKARARWLRAVNRVLRPAHRQELEKQILYRLGVFQPDVLMAYKGGHLTESFVNHCRSRGCLTINVYPDCSPHAHGLMHKHSIGAYDLVISTKPFHPPLWRSTYGYANECKFVSQGYDPLLHLSPYPSKDAKFDIVMVATWRREYGEMLKRLAALLEGRAITVGIGGNGWMAERRSFPADWVFPGELQGQAYLDWLRRGRIALAPLTRDYLVGGISQPGDEDTTRTYELAAAHCFFIHRRTAFVRTLYDEQSEVPMFDSAEELAEKILYFLPREQERERMAAAAHRRAVPAYSLDRRAEEISTLLAATLAERKASFRPA